jgi:hypothetical protein
MTGVPFSTDVFFGPEATRAMGAAFDKVCRSLRDTGQPSLIKEIIAKRIIDLAREGDRDPDHLSYITLKSLGFDAGASCSRRGAEGRPTGG